MPSKNVTRADLTDAVYVTSGLPRHDAALVEQVLSEVCDTLERGETVKLSGPGVWYLCPVRQAKGPYQRGE
jgi:integration host factor subunit alpha